MGHPYIQTVVLHRFRINIKSMTDIGLNKSNIVAERRKEGGREAVACMLLIHPVGVTPFLLVNVDLDSVTVLFIV